MRKPRDVLPSRMRRCLFLIVPTLVCLTVTGHTAPLIPAGVKASAALIEALNGRRSFIMK